MFCRILINLSYLLYMLETLWLSQLMCTHTQKQCSMWLCLPELCPELVVSNKWHVDGREETERGQRGGRWRRKIQRTGWGLCVVPVNSRDSWTEENPSLIDVFLCDNTMIPISLSFGLICLTLLWMQALLFLCFEWFWTKHHVKIDLKMS